MDQKKPFLNKQLPPSFLIRDNFYSSKKPQSNKITDKNNLNPFQVNLKPKEPLKVYDDDFHYEEMPKPEVVEDQLLNQHE